MIDTHCHLDQYEDPVAVARSAERAGVTIIAVTGLPSHYAAGLAHASRLARTRLALGLHPLLVGAHQAELVMFEKYLATTSYVGEVGLDFSHYGRATKAVQLASFRRVLQLLRGQAKFISLHSRGAERETLDALQEFGIQNAVFHWYSGSARLAEQIASEGHYFSVNPAMIGGRSGRRILERVTTESVLTETDGPYVLIKGRAATPQDVCGVMSSLASVWGMHVEAAYRRVESNSRAALSRIVPAPGR